MDVLLIDDAPKFEWDSALSIDPRNKQNRHL